MDKTKMISAYFEADHDRLELIFKEFQRKKCLSMAEAKPYFKVFNNGLKRHIVWEEDVLFPFFERKTGIDDSGLTCIMREEHRTLGAALERLHDKVRKLDTACDREEESLVAFLSEHNQKEEQVLYPALDQILTEQEAAEMLTAMESIPAERYQTCCGGHH